MKNVIFDFGNVLVQWHPELVFGEYFGDEAKAWWFFRHVIDNTWRLRIDGGESMDACIDERQSQYPEYSEAIALYRDRWREMLTGEVPGMRELLEELLTHSSDSQTADSSPLPGLQGHGLRPCGANLGEQPNTTDCGGSSRNKYQVYGLTNWSMETFPEAREHFGILQMIDRYVVSGAEGYVKPDPRLFQVLLDRYGLKAEECIFVDDNPDNVAAASRMGMQGILFTSAEDLRKQLAI